MKRKIKPVPVLLLVSVLLIIGLYQFDVIPSFAEIKQRFESKSIVIDDITSWTLSDSPVEINKPVEVNPTAVLYIEPGVDVLLGPDVYFSINGTIQVNGTADQPVTFRPADEEQAWKGLYFGGSCSFKTENLVYRETSSFRYARIEGAEYAIKSFECPIDLTHSIISSCVTGLSLHSNSNSRIADNLFQNCGEAILAEQTGEMSTIEMIRIENNEFLDCDHITLNTSALFKNNQVHDFNTVYSALLVAPPDSHRVHVQNNQFTNLDRALEIETIKNAEVLVSRNCFKENGINLYLNCNNNSQAAIQIRSNNFLDYKTFNVKALTGCNELQEERIPLFSNWWGTSDMKKIEASIWQYNSASSIIVQGQRFSPTSCVLPQADGDASLVKVVKESIVPNQPDSDKSIAQIREEEMQLKQIVPESNTNDITINAEGGMIVINGDTVKLPGGQNIAPILDSLMKEKFTITTETTTKPDRPSVSNTPIEIPAEAIVHNFAFDKPGENNMVYVCRKGVYTAYNKANQTIYADKGSKIFLNSTGNHTVYLAKGAEIKVSEFSKNNIIHYHPAAKLTGNLSTNTIQYKVANPNLEFVIDPSRKSEVCLFEYLVED